MSDYEVDVVVMGSGNGGMSAAIAAARAGARTLVVEIDSVTGGSSAMSGGGIHIGGAKTWEEYLANTHGMHDPALSRAYFDGYYPYIEWLQEIGADICFEDTSTAVRMGTDVEGASQPQARQYFNSLEKAYADAGGQLLLKMRGRKLLTDAHGTITGLRAQSWRKSPLETNGPQIDIKAKHVILAAGGFQNNKELCNRYVGPEADLIAALGSPYHRGEGLLIGQEVGAALSGSMSGIYGALMSAFPARRPMQNPEEWEAAGEEGRREFFSLMWYSPPPGFIAVNLHGKRFIDESDLRYRIGQAVARQPRATGIMLFDEAMFAEIADIPVLRPGTGTSEREKLAIKDKIEGRTIFKADTIEELADALAAISPTTTYKANLLRTIEECSRAADAGDTNMEVHRTNLGKLTTPPFYAYPFTAGVVYTMGGLAINANAQVLDRQLAPIPGLYASPPCAGGVFRDYYAGSIASAGVFGWYAGRHAAANLG